MQSELNAVEQLLNEISINSTLILRRQLPWLCVWFFQLVSFTSSSFKVDKVVIICKQAAAQWKDFPRDLLSMVASAQVEMLVMRQVIMSFLTYKICFLAQDLDKDSTYTQLC